MSVTTGPSQGFTAILENAAPSIVAGDLTVGINDAAGNPVIAQTGLGIVEVEAGLFTKLLVAPADEALYFIVWKLGSDAYAFEDLVVSDTAFVDSATEDVTLRPGLFPPGSTVDVWRRIDLSGPHPPASEPRVSPLRADVTVDSNGEIFLSNMTQNTDYVVGATVGGKWTTIDFVLTEPTNTTLEEQVNSLRQQINGEAVLRVEADSQEALARAAADADEISAREAAIEDLVAQDGRIWNVLEHGVERDTGLDQLIPINACIAALNAGECVGLVFPGGEYDTSETFDQITASGFVIRGDGPPTRLQFLSTAAHGTFFRIGAAGGNAANKGVIRDLTVSCNATGNVPPADERAFHLIKGGSIFVRDIAVENIGGLCKIGSPLAYSGVYSDRMQLYGFRDITGNWNAATANPSRIHVINGTDGRFVNIRLTATEVNGGKGIHADPTPRGVDQHFFDDVECWAEGAYSYNTGHGTTYAGIDENVFLDFTTGTIFNWVFKQCVFDEGRVASVLLNSNSGANSLKNVHFLDCHFESNQGRGVYVTHAGTGDLDCQVIGGHVRYRRLPGVELHGAGVSSFLVQGLSVRQDNSTFASVTTGLNTIVHTYKHDLAVDTEIIFQGTPPTGLSANTPYYVKNADVFGDGLGFTVAASPGGATVGISQNINGSYYVVTAAAIQISDCLGVRVNGCYIGPFQGVNCRTNFAVKGVGSPDFYVISSNVARGLLDDANATGVFSTGLSTSSTKVIANNAGP